MLTTGGESGEEAPDLRALVRAHLGADAIEYSNAVRGHGALVRIETTWRIYVRQRLPIELRAFVIAHELAEWWLALRERYQGEDVEHCANYLAAAVLTPRRAFRAALVAFDGDWRELSDEFRITQTHAALREGEVTGRPIAVVTPHLVRARGRAEWPDEGRLREVARRGAPGLSRVRLTDDRRRVALIGDEAGAA